MWTDTHLHLDASEYGHDRAEVLFRARLQHVNRFVIPSVHPSNFETVRQLAHELPGAVYCLGIHPLYVGQCERASLDTLRVALLKYREDPLLAGVGEIGLDGFVPNPDWPTQTHFFEEQLKLARDLELPVVMHVRRSQDLILKGLRKFRPVSGIAHAFNGSFQQADHFLKLNMVLGFGGACTFGRALQLRRLVSQLPREALVLETDGPDIAPEWINKQRNEPGELMRIAQVIAELRGVTLQELSLMTESNANRALPALNHTD